MENLVTLIAPKKFETTRHQLIIDCKTILKLNARFSNGHCAKLLTLSSPCYSLSLSPLTILSFPPPQPLKNLQKYHKNNANDSCLKCIAINYILIE